MPELLPHEVERLRRSVAMASPGAASGLTREQALALFEQLQHVTAHRDLLLAELAELGYA